MKRWTVRYPVLAILVAILILPASVGAQENAAVETPERREGLVHTVVKGDTLWDLSAKYLDSPWLWPHLWERNRFLTNPHYIYPGIRIEVFPPQPREYVWEVRETPPEGEAAPAAPPSPTEEVAASTGDELPAKPSLPITPEEFVRSGEFLPERPGGIGSIRGGRDPKVAFSEGDEVYLSLDREIPPDQILAVYRVRGPVRSRTARPVSGYVRFLVGILQVSEKRSGEVAAVVRKSFEDLTREDLVSEEIPSYSPVYYEEGAEGVEAFVIGGRSERVELAAGDFVYIDRGAGDGVAVGNVFGIYDGRDDATWKGGDGKSVFPVLVGRGVVVKVLPGSSTVYVTGGTQSFPAGSIARRGRGETR